MVKNSGSQRTSDPFSLREKEIWELLGKAAQLFFNLEQTHPSHLKDFADAIHQCQDVLGRRILQRNYPEYWESYIKDDESEAWLTKKA